VAPTALRQQARSSVTITAHPRASGIGPHDVLPCIARTGAAIKPASCGQQTISCVITVSTPAIVGASPKVITATARTNCARDAGAGYGGVQLEPDPPTATGRSLPPVHGVTLLGDTVPGNADDDEDHCAQGEQREERSGGRVRGGDDDSRGRRWGVCDAQEQHESERKTAGHGGTSDSGPGNGEHGEARYGGG
jgi:hypothetical protein